MLARRSQEAMGEAHVPAEQSQTSQAARVPAPDVDPRRPGHPAIASPQGSPPPVGVGLTRPVWRIRDRATFADLRRDGTRTRSGPVTVTFLPGDTDHPPRVAYAVGRTVRGARA